VLCVMHRVVNSRFMCYAQSSEQLCYVLCTEKCTVVRILHRVVNNCVMCYAQSSEQLCYVLCTE